MVPPPPNVYIRQNGLNQEYSNDQITWNVITWPFIVYGGQTVEFINDLTLTSVDSYLTCNNDYITIGSPTVKPDGSKYTITLDGVINYEGFIRNSGCNNVKIFNLNIVATNGSTLSGACGWVAGYAYGTDGTGNYIVGCSSNGPIPQFSGGIVGAEAATVNLAESANLTIIGCTASGVIANGGGGGIAGEYCGQNSGSIVTIRSCSSSGSTGTSTGGIVGQYAGQGGAICIVTECYSTGLIGPNGGGIFGAYSGDAGTAVAQDCYSRGTIGTSAGGIFGSFAASSGGTTQATNCYSYEVLGSGAGGIYGSGSGVGATETNCYSANGSWSDSAAESNLTDISTIWLSTGVNQPYILFGIGPSPYSLTTIQLSPSLDIIVNYSQTVSAGSSSNGNVLAGGGSFALLGNTEPTITINASTGVVSTTSGTPSALYSLKIYRLYGSVYSTTGFKLNVEGAPPPTPTVVPTKKTLVQDASTYTRIKRTSVGNSGSSSIDPTKLRAPLFYRFYSPYYDVRPNNE